LDNVETQLRHVAGDDDVTTQMYTLLSATFLLAERLPYIAYSGQAIKHTDSTITHTINQRQAHRKSDSINRWTIQHTNLHSG